MTARVPGMLQSLAPVPDRHGYTAVALAGVERFGILNS